MRHTIRKDGKGTTKSVLITPLKAIRYHCLECVCFSSNEVKKCTENLCPMYPYRFGKDPNKKKVSGHRKRSKK